MKILLLLFFLACGNYKACTKPKEKAVKQDVNKMSPLLTPASLIQVY
jgi:hypothetical protein